MENKKITEKESLELISKMIQSTKQSAEIGRGYSLLYYGYFTVILSVIMAQVYILTNQNVNYAWNLGWFLMVVPWLFEMYKKRKNKPKVITHVDFIITKIWRIIGWMFIFTILALIIRAVIYGYIYLDTSSEMIYKNVVFGTTILHLLGLSLLYFGIGISITGIILKERSMIYLPLIAILIAILILTLGNFFAALLYGFAFIPMMIIPGHILNKKARKQC